MIVGFLFGVLYQCVIVGFLDQVRAGSQQVEIRDDTLIGVETIVIRPFVECGEETLALDYDTDIGVVVLVEVFRGMVATVGSVLKGLEVEHALVDGICLSSERGLARYRSWYLARTSDQRICRCGQGEGVGPCRMDEARCVQV